MANQALVNPGRALDMNGYVAPGAKATFYASGTSTLIPVFADKEETIPAANPAIADANGVFPQRFANGQVKVVVTSASDETLYTLDPAPVVQSTGAGASQISFEPTVALPFSDVQAAIEGAAAAASTGFLAFGLGRTTDGVEITDINNTTLGTGFYRTTAATVSGTFPTGYAAGSLGNVFFQRRLSTASSAGHMFFMSNDAAPRLFMRRLNAGAWGAWAEIISAPQGSAEGDILYRGAAGWVRLAKGTAGQALVMNSGATAPQWGGVFISEYVSAEQTITTGGTLTLTHGLGARPRLISYELVCKTAEFGYAIGDIVPIGIMSAPSGSLSYNAAAIISATEIVLRFANSSEAFLILNATTGASATLTNSRWRLVVRAYL